MFTYVALNCVFLAGLLAFAMRYRRSLKRTPLLLSLIIVIVLTALFDPVMIGVGLVGYDPTKLLGMYWFGAPIEDFSYALLAVPLVALLWNAFEAKND